MPQFISRSHLRTHIHLLPPIGRVVGRYAIPSHAQVQHDPAEAQLPHVLSEAQTNEIPNDKHTWLAGEEAKIMCVRRDGCGCTSESIVLVSQTSGY